MEANWKALGIFGRTFSCVSDLELLSYGNKLLCAHRVARVILPTWPQNQVEPIQTQPTPALRTFSWRDPRARSAVFTLSNGKTGSRQVGFEKYSRVKTAKLIQPQLRPKLRSAVCSFPSLHFVGCLWYFIKRFQESEWNMKRRKSRWHWTMSCCDNTTILFQIHSLFFHQSMK